MSAGGNFDQALAFTLRAEGGYVDHSNDAGGETYRGISRVNWPKWEGWKVIDSLHALGGFPGSLDQSRTLPELVADFYRVNYWQPVRGDELPERIALELFDSAVFFGIRHAVEFLQRALNLLNRSDLGARQRYPELTVDGLMGAGTLGAAQASLRFVAEDALLTWINGEQAKHLIERIERDPSQEAFAAGWAKRVQIIRTV